MNELFETEGSTVKLKRNPDVNEINQVKAALVEIMNSGADTVMLDMTSTGNLNSTTVGMAVAVHLRAVEADKKLTVRINKAQRRLFELTMLTNTLSLEVAE